MPAPFQIDVEDGFVLADIRPDVAQKLHRWILRQFCPDNTLVAFAKELQKCSQYASNDDYADYENRVVD